MTITFMGTFFFMMSMTSFMSISSIFFVLFLRKVENGTLVKIG